MPHTARTLTAPYWQRQEGEPPRAFSRFAVYLEQPRGARSYTWVAERCGVRRQTVHEQAQTWRWDDRAAAHDAETSRQLRERALAAAEEELHNQIAASAELLAGARRAVATTAPDAAQAARWAETASKLLGQALSRLDGPGTENTVAGASGDALSGVQLDNIPELQGLGPTEQRDRIQEIVASLVRLDAYEQREAAAGQGPQGPRQG